MKRTAILVTLVVVAAGVFYLWCRESPDKTEAPVSREQAPQVDRAVPEPADESAHPRARPRVPVPQENGPSAPVERVDFHRRPWDPKKETREKYEQRAELFEAFDRFVEETGMSEERARALLMLMYDFQETVRILDAEMENQRPYRHQWHFESLLRKKWADWETVMFDTHQQLYAMLSPGEMRAWRRTLGEARVWMKLSAGIVFGRLILPVETP